MVSLRERALKAAEEERKQWKEKASNFAAEAKKEFQKRFGEVSELDVKQITENMAEITADGLNFTAKREYRECDEHIKFYIEVKCSECSKMFTHSKACETLADIGYRLESPGSCKACWMKRLGNITLEREPLIKTVMQKIKNRVVKKK